MKTVDPISFPEAPRRVIGAGREDVSALTAVMVSVPGAATIGGVATVIEWEPTDLERERITHGARVRLWVYQCGQPLQPLSMDVSPLPDTEPVRLVVNGREHTWPRGIPFTWGDACRLAELDPARHYSCVWSKIGKNTSGALHPFDSKGVSDFVRIYEPTSVTIAHTGNA